MSDFPYSDAVKQHFLHPKNYLMGDESAFQYDGRGVAGNPVCGDEMIIMIKVKDDRITDIAWKTYGCASAIASTSALSELAKGQTLDQAAAITAQQVADYLGGLPEHKFHCSVLGFQALRAAVADYRGEAKASETPPTSPASPACRSGSHPSPHPAAAKYPPPPA
ncbi:iron-sulfur cluster assembly scaffold protein [Candidatus Saccharibacteria bacterium]|nr:iron-sulfur cluster assembly scaffold protein [Candidatus Saccharibacteria bacterium]